MERDARAAAEADQSFWLGCRSAGTGECALSSSSPLTAMFAQLLNNCMKSDRFETLVAHCTLPDWRVSRRSNTRPSKAPVAESRASMTSVASPASVVYVRDLPADIVSGALM